MRHLSAHGRFRTTARRVAPATRERGVPITLHTDPGLHRFGATRAAWATSIYRATLRVLPLPDSHECTSVPVRNVAHFECSGPNTLGARPDLESASQERHAPAWHWGGMKVQRTHADFSPDAP